MKCKVIITVLPSTSNTYLVEDPINEWLKENQDIKIIFVSQAGFGNRNIATTIFYE
ncbi:MAG: hypothetical protein ACFFDW_01665 [Candidatus Thorarchaeota archaeon]